MQTKINIPFKSSAELAAAFKKWRSESGLSLRAVAAEVDISNAYLSQFERSKYFEISFDKALKLIEVMQRPIKKRTEVRGVFV